MSGYEAYPEYRDSGVEWIGDVPSSWKINRLKHLCQVGTGDKDTVDAVEGGSYPFFVRSQTVERINSIGADCEAVLTAGDGVGVGKVYHYIDGKFDFHQRVYMLNGFKKANGKYFYYYLSSNFHKVALGGNAKSTVDSLRLPQFLNFEITFPSEKDQRGIVNFLDHETAKIDTLIEKQQQLIKLLKEKRQAVISHAVTKGLNPDAPMKDSGVEWLGEVPEHWKQFPLKVLLRLKHGYPFDSAEFSTEGNLVLMTPGNFIQQGGFRRMSPEKYFIGSNFPKEFILEAGQLLVAMTEQGPGLLGSALFVPPDKTYLHNQRLGLIQNLCRSTLNEKYLFHIFNSSCYRAEVSITATGAKVQHTSPDKMLAVKIWVPPLREQVRIASFVDSRIAKIGVLRTKAENAIKLLQERRTALISAAVTGKIDVRNWQPSADSSTLSMDA